jgi:uncharacterized protein with PIN domain
MLNAMPRFLCDEMLGRLCRYLRAAGYDTLQAREGTSDAALLQQCHTQGRQFLTLDTLINEHKAARDVAFILPDLDLDHLATILAQHYRLDWLGQSFTRCLLDNTLLVAADAAALSRAPDDAIRPGETIALCPACNRVYWRGSHYKRMHARLKAWQAALKN